MHHSAELGYFCPPVSFFSTFDLPKASTNFYANMSEVRTSWTQCPQNLLLLLDNVTKHNEEVIIAENQFFRLVRLWASQVADESFSALLRDLEACHLSISKYDDGKVLSRIAAEALEKLNYQEPQSRPGSIYGWIHKLYRHRSSSQEAVNEEAVKLNSLVGRIAEGVRELQTNHEGRRREYANALMILDAFEHAKAKNDVEFDPYAVAARFSYAYPMNPYVPNFVPEPAEPLQQRSPMASLYNIDTASPLFAPAAKSVLIEDLLAITEDTENRQPASPMRDRTLSAGLQVQREDPQASGDQTQTQISEDQPKPQPQATEGASLFPDCAFESSLVPDFCVENEKLDYLDISREANTLSPPSTSGEDDTRQYAQ